jgi:hypothetical protein
VSYQVRVAPVAGDLPTLLPPVGAQGFDLPYSRRLAVELEVADGETLASVYARALEYFEPTPDPSVPAHLSVALDRVHFAWFYEPGDEHGLASTKLWEWIEDLITVDASGRAWWNRGADEIPYADVVRAGELGLLRGDPLRPYLILVQPQGSVDFSTAWEITKRAWEILGHLLLAREVGKLVIGEVRRRRMAETLKRGSVVVERYRFEWETQRGGPAQILKTIDRRPWALEDLRMVLGLASTEEAADLLVLYGFQPNNEGLYEISEAWERVLHVAATDAAYATTDPTLDPERHSERLLHLLKTGALPQVWEEDEPQ